MIVLTMITLGAVTSLVLGFGPVAGGSGGDGGGPVFPLTELGGDDGPERVHLHVEVGDETIRVGQRVAITVVDGDGAPVSNATVAVGEREYRTGPNGTVVHGFESGGDRRIVAKKIGSEEVIYQQARTTVAVQRRIERLSVTTNATTVEAGRPVEVRVTGPDGDPVAATVTAGPRRVATGADGEAVVRIASAGNYSVTASRPPTADTEYVAESESLVVERRSVGLTVTVNDSSIVAGERVQVTVRRRDTGRPVAATVVANGTAHETGPDGTTTLAFGRAGTVAVAAEAPPTGEVAFRPIRRILVVDRRTIPLSLSVSERRPRRGERVTFTLRRADTGQPVAGGIRIGGHVYPTGEDGRLRLGFAVPGTVTVTGVKADTPAARFVSTHRRVVVRGPYHVVTGVGAPAEARPNATVRVTATVGNVGNEAGSATVTVGIGGREVATRTVRTPAGASRTIHTTVTLPDATGTYRITVVAGGEGASTTVRVVEESGARVDRPWGSDLGTDRSRCCH